MSKTNKGIILMAATVMTGWAGAAAGQDALPSNEMEALFACQSQSDDAARLLCFDQTVSALKNVKAGSSITLSRDQIESLEQDAFGFDLPSFKQVRELLKSKGAQKADPENESDDDDLTSLDRVTLEVARWETFRSGRYRFYLTNGQVWSQTESDRLTRPRKGDDGVVKVEIRKNSFGSFFLRLNGKGRSVRVRRSE